QHCSWLGMDSTTELRGVRKARGRDLFVSQAQRKFERKLLRDQAGSLRLSASCRHPRNGAEATVLSQDEFVALIRASREDLYPPDDEQAKAVYADPRADLFIVAGPGTGKTSCLSFRALYLIFVAGLRPRSIMATTFTRKAAAELRSRVLG